MDRTPGEEVELDPLYQPDTPAHSFTFQLYSWLQPVLFALTVLVIVSTFLGRLIGVEGNSMVPTLHNKDMLILQSIGYTPKQGDVVVVAPPTLSTAPPSSSGSSPPRARRSPSTTTTPSTPPPARNTPPAPWWWTARPWRSPTWASPCA